VGVEEYADRLSSLLVQEKSLRDQREKLERDQREVENFIKAKKALEEGDHDTALQLQGLSWEDLTAKYLSGDLKEGKVQREVAEQIKANREKLESLEKTLASREQEVKKANFLKEVRDTVGESSDLPFLRVHDDWVEKVYDHCVSTYEKTQKILTVDEAAKELESKYADQFAVLAKARGIDPKAPPVAPSVPSAPPVASPSPEDVGAPTAPEELDFSPEACTARALQVLASED